MPLYEHYCTECDKITAEVCRIADRKQFVKCEHCGGSAERIISATIQRVEPTWLDSAVSNLADSAKNEIKDRNDYQRYLKREGIVERG